MAGPQMKGPAGLEPEARSWSERLLRDGYCTLPGLVPPEEIERLDTELAPEFEATPFCEGRFYGERTKRFGRLLSRCPGTALLVQHPLILEVVEHVLRPWCDAVQLNLTQAIAIHPGALAQMPHRDQDMWDGPKGMMEYVVNVMWPLTPFRRHNGATRLWPHSHGARALIADNGHDEMVPPLDPGAALLFLGSTLHAAGANRSHEIRRGIIAGYSLGWLKTYENQFLAYPPQVARQFAPALADLVGYRQHRPNLGNFEGRCPSILLRDDPPERPGAADALRPEQTAAVDAHADGQLQATGA